MTHIRKINGKSITKISKVQGCGECQASCQSACKTSCTVGNQKCENTRQ
ncbi:MAG: six-cysteine ranthipeptide SCIFF [Eubacteriales bacterium]|nr:six-cysteine ranthipeptide SCIFF [Eubacteriales bacterium]